MDGEEIIVFEGPESQANPVAASLPQVQEGSGIRSTSGDSDSSNSSSDDSMSGQQTNPPQNPVPTTTITIPKPRIGGVINVGTSYEVAYCGGTNFKSNSQPRTAYAERSLDQRSRLKIEDCCRAGIAKELRIEWHDDPEKRAAQLVPWVKEVRAGLEALGLEGVFYLWDPSANTELSLFTTFGKATMEKVNTYVNLIQNGGLPWPNEQTSGQDIQDTVKANTTCKYDKENLRLSATFMQHAIGTNLWGLMRAELPHDAPGPAYMVSVASKMQGLTPQQVRHLCNELDALELKAIPGEDVLQLNTQINTFVFLIIGSGTVVEDLCYLAAKPFSKSTVEQFRLEFGPFLAAARTEKDMSKFQVAPQEAIRIYNEMTNDWAPQANRTSKKEQQEMVGLIASEVTKQLKRTIGSGTPGGGKGFKCYNCGKEGHMARDCPEPDRRGGGGGGGGDAIKKKGVLADWRTKAPAEGTSQKKTVDGVEYVWCGKCRQGKGMWTSGKKLHSTDQHRAGRSRTDPNNNSNADGEQGHLAVVNPTGILDCVLGGAKA